MSQKVQKWGNSLAVRIPKAIAAQVHLEEGTPLTLSVEEGKLVLAKARRRRRHTLEELLDRVTDDNIHPETDWGPPVGRERFWEERTK